MNTIRFIAGLPAFEWHKEKDCQILLFVDSNWHAWDLPCDDQGHKFAVDEDVARLIDRIKKGETATDPIHIFQLREIKKSE